MSASRVSPDFSGLSSNRVFLDKGGLPFVWDKAVDKIFRISGDKLSEIESPARKLKIAFESSVISEKEASKMARMGGFPSRPR